MILVDSDILIAHLRGVDAARCWLLEARTQGPLAISVVSIAEIAGGMRSAERREAWQLFSSFRAEPVTDVAARRAGEFGRRYRRSHSGIGLGDLLIAATVDVKGYRLATLNIRQFPMFAGLRAPFRL